MYIYIKQLFDVVETFFFNYPSFGLVGSEFLFRGNSILLSTAFPSSFGNHYKL